MARRTTHPTKAKSIAPVHYAPAGGYALDLEILSTAKLRAHASAAMLGRTERLEFHLLIFVTSGRCHHMVDFETVQCVAGTLLMLRPGQVHRFDMSNEWQGWLLLFRPEFLQSKITASPIEELQLLRVMEDLPSHIHLNKPDASLLLETVVRMDEDSRIAAAPNVLNALLRSELQSVLIRLHLQHTRTAASDTAAPLLLERFKRFRTLVDQEFHRKHHVREYAHRLGCSEKSLTRSTLEIAGVNAKRFVTQRIVLEAKRLLSHTTLPVATIADKLGFDEATNFVKFFRRETRLAPGEFRRRETSTELTDAARRGKAKASHK